MSIINFKDYSISTNTMLFGSLSTSDSINLRDELHWILFGTGSKRPLGHWIAYRRFSTTHSQYWNEATKEGVGGPPFTYIDTPLKTRRVPMQKKGDQLIPLKPGADIEDVYTYYFEYNVNPKVGDSIFELELENHLVTLSSNISSSYYIGNITYRESYLIKRVHDYRLENGAIQYWMAIAERDQVRY